MRLFGCLTSVWCLRHSIASKPSGSISFRASGELARAGGVDQKARVKPDGGHAQSDAGQVHAQQLVTGMPPEPSQSPDIQRAQSGRAHGARQPDQPRRPALQLEQAEGSDEHDQDRSEHDKKGLLAIDRLEWTAGQQRTAAKRREGQRLQSGHLRKSFMGGRFGRGCSVLRSLVDAGKPEGTSGRPETRPRPRGWGWRNEVPAVKSLLPLFVVLVGIALGARWSETRTPVDTPTHPLWPHDLVMARTSVSLCDLECWQAPKAGEQAPRVPLGSFAVSKDGRICFTYRAEEPGHPIRKHSGQLLRSELAQLERVLEEAHFSRLPAELTPRPLDPAHQAIFVLRSQGHAVQVQGIARKSNSSEIKRFNRICWTIQDLAAPAFKDVPNCVHADS